MFLKKLAAGIIKGAQVAAAFQPGVAAVSPKAGEVVFNELNEIAELVAAAEVMSATVFTPGPQRAKAIAPLVAQVMMRSPLMSGKKIKDQEAFLAVCERIGGNVADLLNQVE